MPTRTFIVTGEQDSARLDKCIASNLSGLSRSHIQRIIRDGKAAVNGEVVTRPSCQVASGDHVAADAPDAVASGEPAARRLHFGVLFEDEHLIVVDKPAGLPTHPGAGHEDDTLVNGILELFPEVREAGDPSRPGIVHRLDKDTSGLLVVGRTPPAFEALAEAVRDRRVERDYTVLARGRVDPEAGVIDAPIGRDPRNRQSQAVVDPAHGGRPARTRYRVAERLRNTTLLRASLETGRMHQIRVHLASISRPVCGDPVYGRAWPGPGGLKRQFLHASRLALTHPITGEMLEFTSPLPDDLGASLEQARRD
ncbi:MAG: RluA family pseudouridine synthase [Chloroflexota bacterium]